MAYPCLPWVGVLQEDSASESSSPLFLLISLGPCYIYFLDTILLFHSLLPLVNTPNSADPFLTRVQVGPGVQSLLVY